MLLDNRTKPASEWTFYVVDHLPTMSNLYRYDTVDEALAKYREIPEEKRSAIGASIKNLYELDIIHRRADNTPVLVMDFEKNVHPEWRSEEIQNTIDLLIAELRVQYQYDSNIFGHLYNPICIELERYKGNDLDQYFSEKTLRINDSVYLQPNNPLITSIDEVFVAGEGWMKTPNFLSYLYNSRPQQLGDPSKDVFVESINVNYITKKGERGQADISPREYKLLSEKTLQENLLGKKPELNKIINEAKNYLNTDNNNQKNHEMEMER